LKIVNLAIFVMLLFMWKFRSEQNPINSTSHL